MRCLISELFVPACLFSTFRSISCT